MDQASKHNESFNPPIKIFLQQQWLLTYAGQSSLFLVAKCPGKDKRTMEQGFVSKISGKEGTFQARSIRYIALKNRKKVKSTTLLLNIHYIFITSSFFPLPIPQPCEMPIVLIKYVLVEPEDQLVLGFTLGAGGTEKGEILDFPLNRKRTQRQIKLTQSLSINNNNDS